MKKAVFFDVDGTLWDRKMNIPESTRTAMRLLKENGVYRFICSGRTLTFLQSPKLKALDFDGVLAGCGTYVSFQGQELLHETIAPELVQKTIDILQKYQMPIVLEGKRFEYVRASEMANDPYFPVLKKELGERLLDIDAHTMQWEVSKFNAVISDADMEGAVKDLETCYDIMIHDNVVIEGVPKGFNKASGIRMICDHLGIEHQNTYAFGDSINDKEMLEYVAHGIAMGNGTKAAKAVADYVTDSLHEDGIYNACRHFGLI